MTKACSLTSKQINRVLKTCKIMSQSESKCAVIALSHCAIRISEISQITVKTVLFPSGKIRDEIFLPASICKNLNPRTAWLSHKSKKIIQEWVNYRKSKNWGVMPHSPEYQQLNPKSKLIFSNRGCSYSIQNKRRIMKDGSVKVYKACDSLEVAVRLIYKNAV